MNLFPLIASVLFLLIGASCSTVSKNNQQEEVKVLGGKEIVSEEMRSLTRESASIQMKKLIGEAKKRDQDYINYLASDLYLKASDASFHGDNDTAAFILENLRELKSTDSFLKKKLAIEYIKLGRLDRSLPLLKDLFVEEKGSEEVGLVLAGVYTALKERKEAKATYQVILEKHKGSEEACVFLAKAYVFEKKFKQADKLINGCKKVKKGSALFAYFQGKVRMGRGHKKLALKHFKEALKTDPSYYQAALALGVIYEGKEQWGQAVKSYKSLLKHSPNNTVILSRLVEVLFSIGEGKQVIPYAERLSNYRNDDLNLKVRLGILYTDSKRIHDAIGVFKEVLAEVPTSDKVLYYLGSLYQEIQNYENAISTYGKIEEASALFHDGHLQIARILNTMVVKSKDGWKGPEFSRFTTFIKEKSEKHQALKVELNIILAGHFEKIGKFTESIKVLTSVQKEKGFSENHLYYLASVYEKIKDYEKSEALIKGLLEKKPNNPHALNFLGYSLLERKENMDLAYQYISKAVSLKPDDGFIRDSLGWYYYQVGKIHKALEETKKAFGKVKDDVVITKHLAQIYQKMKHYSLAEKFYKIALKNCKIDDERNDVMKAMEGLNSVRLPASKK